ncbi:MAG: Ig-like domain-containing protein, partial [Clostridia bacterium]|nr:Ig-like domain-containing protein [Clostridia bacterium]
MKKLLILLVSAIMVFCTNVFGAYKVEIDDDTYVSNKTYFEPVSTWDEVEARTINLKEGKIIFYAGEENKAKINAEVMPVNTTNKKITYKSEDITIASVDEEGNVYSQGKAGETIIDVTCGKAKAKVK